MRNVQAQPVMNVKKVIDYIVVCINEFASRYELPEREAFHYLSQYQGVQFLLEHYEIEHTLSLNDAVDDLTLICRNNGGTLG